MIGIIGGTGIYDIVEMAKDVQKKVVETPYGESPEISLLNCMELRWPSCPDMRQAMQILHTE